MAAKAPHLGADILALLLNGTPIPNLADNAGSAPVTTLYVALHTSDPTLGTDQTAYEVTYAGYARAAVPRTSGGWTVSGASASPSAPIAFPEGTGGGGIAYFASIGAGASGPTRILYAGALAPPIALGSGITPQLLTSAKIVEQ